MSSSHVWSGNKTRAIEVLYHIALHWTYIYYKLSDWREIRFDVDEKSLSFHCILRRLHHVKSRNQRLKAKLKSHPNCIEGSVCLHRKCSVFRSTVVTKRLPLKRSVAIVWHRTACETLTVTGTIFIFFKKKCGAFLHRKIEDWIGYMYCVYVAEHRWTLGMGPKSFHPTLYWICDYLSMLGLKLNHVSKRAPWWTVAA